MIVNAIDTRTFPDCIDAAQHSSDTARYFHVYSSKRFEPAFSGLDVTQRLVP